MASISIGGMLGPGTSTMLDQAGVANAVSGAIAKQLDEVMKGMPSMLDGLQKAFQGLEGGPATGLPTGMPGAGVGTMMTKALFPAVRQDAVAKATESGSFTIETAVNDLWVKLDPVRKFAASRHDGTAKVELSRIEGQAVNFKEMLPKLKQIFDAVNQSRPEIWRQTGSLSAVTTGHRALRWPPAAVPAFTGAGGRSADVRKHCRHLSRASLKERPMGITVPHMTCANRLGAVSTLGLVGCGYTVRLWLKAAVSTKGIAAPVRRSHSSAAADEQ